MHMTGRLIFPEKVCVSHYYVGLHTIVVKKYKSACEANHADLEPKGLNSRWKTRLRVALSLKPFPSRLIKLKASILASTSGLLLKVGCSAGAALPPALGGADVFDFIIMACFLF
jgi:hypothetical protein